MDPAAFQAAIQTAITKAIKASFAANKAALQAYAANATQTPFTNAMQANRAAYQEEILIVTQITV